VFVNTPCANPLITCLIWCLLFMSFGLCWQGGGVDVYGGIVTFQSCEIHNNQAGYVRPSVCSKHSCSYLPNLEAHPTPLMGCSLCHMTWCACVRISLCCICWSWPFLLIVDHIRGCALLLLNPLTYHLSDLATHPTPLMGCLHFHTICSSLAGRWSFCWWWHRELPVM
jgi:hypothetical protein